MSKTFTSRPSQTFGRGRGTSTNQSNNRQTSPTRGRGSSDIMQGVRGGRILPGAATRTNPRVGQQNPGVGVGVGPGNGDMTSGAASSPQENSQELGQRMS